MTNERTTTRFSWLTHPALFAVAQVVLFTACVALLFGRSEPSGARPALPPLNNQPLTVAPQYDVPEVISDAQLAAVLDRLRPRLRHTQPKINYVDHALRFWGVEATFADPECLSGDQLRRILTDQQAFAQAWGEQTRPLLSARPDGVAVRTQQGAATASHVDHSLATLAEVGTPLNYEITTPEGTSSVRDLLEHALRQFRLNQQEYEWTVLATALYAPTSQAWYSREGQRITFDQLAARLIRQQCVQGVCYGNHRLYTLAILLRVDDEQQIFEDPSTRQRVIDHLTDMTRRLVASQSPNGYWDKNWFDPTASTDDSQFQPLTRQLLATGHALEWWAMAPVEVLPPREVLVRAGQWLVVAIEKLDDKSIEDNYTFLSHVGRALALWRGDFPARLMKG